jgi:hypothetical protein
MKKSASNEIKRGQAISFRVPSDTPDHLLKQLQKVKETERRNFSSKMAEFVLHGVSQSLKKEQETITIPLPHKLSKSQRDWLKHEHSEALLGSILYHLLTDPVRATALLASLNSSSLDINEALYLQEEASAEEIPTEIEQEEILQATELEPFEDDLESFDWDQAKQSQSDRQEDEKEESENGEDDLESLLGDFLAEMNK